MQEPDVAEKSCLHRHTGPLWMKEDDSLTLPYTQYGVYVTIDLRKTILLIPLVHTQPHTILHHYGSWEVHGPLQTSGL